MRSEPCPKETAHEQSRLEKRLGLAAAVLASSMAFIDGSALNVALPALSADFSGGFSVVQWVINSYVIALAGLTIPGGAAADIFGRKQALFVGVILFALASLCCAFAPNASILIVSRFVQGAAAALMTPASLALIGELFAKDERSKAIGFWAAASALTTSAGPLLGGFLVESIGWRAIFAINLPISAIAILLLIQIKAPGVRKEMPFDVIGALMLTAAMGTAAFAFTNAFGAEGNELAGGDHTRLNGLFWIALVISVLLLGLYFWRQKTAANPLTPIYLFRLQSFNALNTTTVFLYTGLSIVFVILPFDLIARRGLSAASAGLAFLPFTLAVGILSNPIGGMEARYGAKLLIALGALTAGLGFILMAILSDYAIFLSVFAPMALTGLGFALVIAPLTAGIMLSVALSDQGLASGINNTASRVAQMLGVAIAGYVAVDVAGKGIVSAAYFAAFLALLAAATTLLGFSPKK
ncbi:MAG: MFS transporter [Pseudomonadota bacterium]